MKILIIYYSHYGNTAYAADKFSSALGKLGQTDTHELEYVKGRQSLFMRFLYRMFPSLVELSPVPTDLKDYDILFLGIPVWGGRPSGAVAKYLSLCKNLDHKKIICCYVYGMETSARNCAKYVHKVLERKGNPVIVDAYVAWANIQKEYPLAQIVQSTLEKILQASA